MSRSPDFSALLAGLTCYGYSQADLARRLQLDPSTVSRLITGEIRQPSYQTGVRILSFHDKSLKRQLSTLNR